MLLPKTKSFSWQFLKKKILGDVISKSNQVFLAENPLIQFDVVSTIIYLGH